MSVIILLGSQCYRHKETTPAIWTACLQGKNWCYVLFTKYIVSESQKSDFEMFQGSKNIAVSRSFVNYIANSEISRQLRVSTFLIIIVIVVMFKQSQHSITVVVFRHLGSWRAFHPDPCKSLCWLPSPCHSGDIYLSLTLTMHLLSWSPWSSWWWWWWWWSSWWSGPLSGQISSCARCDRSRADHQIHNLWRGGSRRVNTLMRIKWWLWWPWWWPWWSLKRLLRRGYHPIDDNNTIMMTMMLRRGDHRIDDKIMIMMIMMMTMLLIRHIIFEEAAPERVDDSHDGDHWSCMQCIRWRAIWIWQTWLWLRFRWFRIMIMVLIIMINVVVSMIEWLIDWLYWCSKCIDYFNDGDAGGFLLLLLLQVDLFLLVLLQVDLWR